MKGRKKKKKILILAANPGGNSRLRLDKEIREIEDGLRLAKHREQFEIKTWWAVRDRDIRRAMLEYEPNIVHFCGHGEKDGLMVEDESGKAVLIQLEALAGLFEFFANRDYVPGKKKRGGDLSAAPGDDSAAPGDFSAAPELLNRLSGCLQDFSGPLKNFSGCLQDFSGSLKRLSGCMQYFSGS